MYKSLENTIRQAVDKKNESVDEANEFSNWKIQHPTMSTKSYTVRARTTGEALKKGHAAAKKAGDMHPASDSRMFKPNHIQKEESVHEAATIPGKGQNTWMKDGVEMCPEACCGESVMDCECGTDCKECNCAERKEMMKAEAYNEPQGQAKSMMSPLHKARMDKEKTDRDRDGKLKPGVVKVKKEEVEVEEAKKVSSMQMHKVLASTKNSREGVAALKKAFKVNDAEAKKMLNRLMNEETIDEISRSMTPMRKKFGGTVDPKKFDMYKKHIKQHKVDEPTVRMIVDNPDDAESKRMMKNKHVAQAVSLRKAAMKESVEIDEAKKPDETINIYQSLKKAIDMRGQKEVVFKDGSKAKISVQDAEKAMKMLDTTRMAKAKQMLTIRMMKSHQEFKDVLSGKKQKVDPFALKVRTNEEMKHAPAHIKQAIGIASDPRYKAGNMTGAVKAMNKLSPGIDQHPQVAAVLKRQNEATIPDGQTAMTKKPEITKKDKDTVGKIQDMMRREREKRLSKETAEEGFANAAQQAAVMAKLKKEGKYKQKNEDTSPKVIRHLDLAKKARAEGDYAKANMHTKQAREAQMESSFIPRFKLELKELKKK